MKRKNSLAADDIPCRRQCMVKGVGAQVLQNNIEINKMASMEIESEENQMDVITQEESTLQCKIYWSKNIYDVEVDLNEPLLAFKAQIFALTQVDPERQKVIFQGKILKDENWPDMTIKNGSKLCMIGTNDVIVMPTVAVEEKTTKAPTQKLPPYGIKNFGNTCYMNSVLQVIRCIPELKEAIIKHTSDIKGKPNEILEQISVKSLSQLYTFLDQRSEQYEQHMHEFISTLERIYPEYTSSIEKGGRLQQDANEFFMRLLSILKKHLNCQVSQYVKGRDLIETMFGLDMEKTFKCLDKGGDSAKSSSQTELQLSCFINIDTKFMIDGIKSKLNEIITKHSQILNKDANFSINTNITRLPPYLCVQFVRFFYKEEEKVNAKIMRDVKFPLRLDLTDLCSPSLKEKLKPMQIQIREFENKLSFSETDSARRLLLKRQEAGIVSLPEQKFGAGDSGAGIYQLVAVLTHQGRSASSGHYISWIKIDDKQWAKLDDNVCSFVDEDDILKLSGGGEFHSAYLLIYQTFKIPKP